MARKAKPQEDQPVASSSRVQLDAEDLADAGKKRKRGGTGDGATKKRQRKTKPKSGDGDAVAEGRAVVKGRRRRDLSLLPTMPFDVIYEILARLTVKDVVSVSRVNAEWCKLLCSKAAVPLWKELRHKEEVPEPHPDISEAEWARFLFCGLNCEVCGTRAIQAPDFGIRRRVCSSCKKNKLVPKKSLAKEYPQYGSVIADFLPYTYYNGSWMHAYERNTPFFWPVDIEEVGQKWTSLQRDVWNRVPGAQERIDAYKVQRREIVSAIEGRVQDLMDWCRTVFDDKSNARYDASQRRKEEIFKRFRAMGYTDSDLWAIEFCKSVEQSRDLTERIWKKIRPELEEKLHSRKRDRLVKERSALIIPGYDSYMKQLKATERIAVPKLKDLFSNSEFDDLAAAPDNVDVNSPVVSRIGTQLPGMVAAWQEEFKKKRQDHIHWRSTSSGWGDHKKYTPLPKDDSNILNLAVLATSCCNFSCRENPSGAILGWERAMHHTSCNEPCHGGIPSGNPVATKVIQLAGLHPGTATIDDMDQIDTLFLCSTCVNNNWENDVHVGRRLHGATVYTWRQAISHALIDRFYPGHSDFEILDREQVVNVLESHKPEPGFSKTWSCDHCDEHYKNLTTLAEVKLHLEAAHNVHKPTFPDDLIAMPDSKSWFRTWPLGFTLKLWIDDVPPPSGCIPYGRFLCDHCSHCTFDVEDIRKHIADSHDGASLDAFRPRKYWQGWMPPPHLEYPTGDAALESSDSDSESD